MFKHVSTQVVPLTPELAQEFATMEPSPGERKKSNARLRFLETRLNNGEFYPPRWSYVWLNGRKYRMNGQHSSTVLADQNGSFPRGMVAVVDEFRCENMKDVPELFNQFDATQSTRTRTDLVNAHAGIHDSLSGLGRSLVMRAVDGIAWAMQHVHGSKRLTTEERARLVHDHGDFIAWAYQFLDVKSMIRVGVVAAMFTTWTKDRRRAEVFWQKVADESHPDPNNASRTLSRFLLETSNIPKAQLTWDSRAFYAKSIHAWNAWKGETTTTLAYFANAGLPKAA